MKPQRQYVSVASHQTIVAPIGPPLGENEPRRRDTARIAATLHRFADRENSEPLLLADHDSCWLGGAPVATLEAWRCAIARGRLADVKGGFVVAWTDADGALHLARDGVGVRTLVYAPLPDGVLLGSSIRSLLATGLVPRRLQLSAVATYLAYAYLPGRETLVEGVHELLAGEHVICSRDGVRREAFWQLPSGPPSNADEHELTAELRHLLEASVRRCLPPPGEPAAAFLSGGLDSSLVVALARRLHDAPIRTFSVSFGAGHANELPFSSAVAAHCGTDHRIVELNSAAVLHHLDDTIGLLNDPIGDPLTVPNALLFRAATRAAGVVLNGEGGDPCFGGPKNLPMLLAELYAPVTGAASREASYLRSHLKCYDDFPAMLSDPMLDALAAAPLEAALAPLLNDPRWPDFVARLQAINIRLKGAHHILPKVDALSAPFGVVPRAPLFDRDVVELSLRLPPRLKLNGSVEKYLLKQAVRDLLPAEIVDRPKSGMLVPVEGWFRGPLIAAARARLLDGLSPYGLLRRDYLERLLAGKLGGLRPRHGAKIWLLVTLEAWLRKVLTG